MKTCALSEIAKATGMTLVGEDKEIKYISTNSSDIKENTLFIALIGERIDAHIFIPKAFENGAVAVVTMNEIEEKPYLLCKDTTKALGDISAYYKSQMMAKTVAVTGSVGKTTTKEMIFAVLNEDKKTLKTKGNFNNQIGLPLTVLQMEENDEYAVLEMGMSNFGEISYLSKIAKADVAVISNIGVSHIEYLGSREGILKAKMEIVDGLKEDGTLVLNGDEPLLWELRHKINAKYFSINNKEANIYVKEVVEKDYSSTVTAVLNGEEITYSLNTIGEHNVLNSLSAVLVAKAFSISNETIKAGFTKFENAKMRQNIIKKNNVTVIEDCYNASPDSIKAALTVLKSMKGKRIAVLGMIGEMGSYSEKGHNGCGMFAADCCDELIVIGEDAKYYKEGANSRGFSNVKMFESHSDIASYLKENIKDETVLLFKGSRFMEMEKSVKLFLED